MSPAVALLIAVLLLFVNAFFVAGEFSVTSTRKSQIEPLVEQGRRGAKDALWTLEHVPDVLSLNQLGITLASTGLGAVAEPAVADLLEPVFHAVGAGAVVAHSIAFLVALLIVVVLHILVGEMVPKNLTVAKSVSMVLVLAPLLVRLTRAVGPLTRALNRLANRVVVAFGFEPRDELASTFTAEEVASIVEESEQQGTIDDDLGLLAGTLQFSEETVGSVMVPLADLVTLSSPCTPADVESLVAKTGYSRFVVLNAAGEPESFLHFKDVLYADAAEREAEIDQWRYRPLIRVDAAREVEEAMQAMRAQKVHVALVVDKSVPVGAVFFEDILEELVGEVRDSMQRQ
ncbi:MAG: hemolysin family protein [Varibaculum sp.]|nr:hemolysin family protein [Varibaculum sp.]